MDPLPIDITSKMESPETVEELLQFVRTALAYPWAFQPSQSTLPIEWHTAVRL